VSQKTTFMNLYTDYMTFNKLFFSTFSLILFSFCFTQEQTKVSIENRTFHGEYRSFHENGQLKSEGNFCFNRRIGDWKVYSDKGELLAHRYYDSLGFAKVFVPTTSEDTVIKLLNKPRHKIKRNESGMYEWKELIEGYIGYAKRVRSFLPIENNNEVYELNWISLLNRFQLKDDLSVEREITIYKNDELQALYKEDEYIDTTSLTLLGVGVKKDYYFDLEVRNMDARVIGVTIFTEDTITKELKDFTFYYPTDLRPLLVKHKINHDNTNIKNLDDLLFFNAYGEIIYEENCWDREKNQFDPRKAFDFIEFSNTVKTQIVEIENGYWVRI